MVKTKKLHSPGIAVTRLHQTRPHQNSVSESSSPTTLKTQAGTRTETREQ